MEQTQAAARPAPSSMTREKRQAQRRRRRVVRLVRNWTIFLAACACIVAVMTSGILWLLPKAHALVSGPETFEAREYDASSYVFYASDARLVLVNGNVPLDSEPSPTLAVADDATGVQLEEEAAEAYRKMAAAALADGIELTLQAGYLDKDARQAAFEKQLQLCKENGDSDDAAASHAATTVPQAECSEYGTGYAADIVSADHTAADSAFANTRAYEWLTAYAAEYGFILRCPEEREAATGKVFQPYHWRYVGTENALAIRASGLSLEEFLAVNLAK